jgi:hypothetical protein
MAIRYVFPAQVVDQSGDRADGGEAREAVDRRSAPERSRRAYRRARHQPLAAERRQRAAVRELRRRAGRRARAVQVALGDGDTEVVLDAKQQIEQVHRAEREIVEQEVLGADRPIGRQRLRRTDQRRDLLERAAVGRVPS